MLARFNVHGNEILLCGGTALVVALSVRCMAGLLVCGDELAL